MNTIRTLTAHRDLLFNLVARELKGRYKGSALGFLWALLTPLFMAVIYIFFMRLLAGRGVPTEEIIIGVFAWQFTAQCVGVGLHCISGNSSLVKKVFFPRIILPVASTLANLVNFVLTLVVQFVLVALLLHANGQSLSAWSLAFPVLIAYQTLFNLGLVLLVSSLNVFFRDIQHIVGLIMTAWFFVTPAMYNLGFVEHFASSRPWLMDAYLLNPMAVIITGYRAMMLPGVAFPWSAAAVASLLWPLLLVGLSLYLFEKLQRYFADMM